MNRVQISGTLRDNPKLQTNLGEDGTGAAAAAVLVYNTGKNLLRLVAVAGMALQLGELKAGDTVMVHGNLRGAPTELFVESIEEYSPEGPTGPRTKRDPGYSGSYKVSW